MKRYKSFLRAGLLDVFAYKFNVLSWMLVVASSLLCLFFLWVAVYRNSPQDIINGFRFQEIIAYTVIINIFSFTVNCSETQDMIMEDIHTGQIAMSLIKPISYRLRCLFTTFGKLIGNNLIFGIPALVIATVLLAGNHYIQIASAFIFCRNLVLFLISELLAVILLDTISYIFGIISFYTLAGFGLYQIKDVIINFLSGGLIPIAFFPKQMIGILNHMPFVGMAQNPTLIFLGKMSLSEALNSILLQIVWLVLLELFAKLFYLRAIRKVTIQGG